MYELLLKMKKVYSHSKWLNLVEQAYNKKVLSEEDYTKLIGKN